MIVIRFLQADEVDAWLDMCTMAFCDGVIQPDFRQELKGSLGTCESDALNNIIVAAQDSRLLGSVSLFDLTLHMAGSTVRACGIGTVCTAIGERGKGISKQILHDATSIIQRRGYPFSLLGTGIPDFYYKLGWRQVACHYNILKGATSKPLQYKVAHVDIRSSLESVISLHNHCVGAMNGMAIRNDESYWRQHLLSNPGFRWLIAKSGCKSPVAYLTYTVNEEMIVVREFGCEPGHNSSVNDLLLYACNESGSACKVKCPAFISTEFQVIATEQRKSKMLRIENPFICNDSLIENTEQLLAIAETPIQDKGIGGFFFWDFDGF